MANRRFNLRLVQVRIPRDVVSVETVLNSRCSSDFDGDPKRNHWGAYTNSRPPGKVVDRILRCCEVPRFSSGRLLNWFDGDYLFLGFEKTSDSFEERVLHIESGMQHEAVHLACAAFGVGTCIHNMGVDGTVCRGKVVTARHLILEMDDCYEGGKHTSATPGPEMRLHSDKNLPDPRRASDVECLPELERLTVSRSRGSSVEMEETSQLLWAAKGITPHYAKGHPWGLTIPTWGHGTEYTSVYLVKDQQLFRYLNWTNEWRLLDRSSLLRYAYWKLQGRSSFHIMGQPTHEIEFVGTFDPAPQLEGSNTAIVLSQNEKTNRTLWEAGYMLENMLLQSRSLGISYKAKIFSPEETSCLARKGVGNAVVAVLL